MDWEMLGLPHMRKHASVHTVKKSNGVNVCNMPAAWWVHGFSRELLCLILRFIYFYV